MMIDWGWLKKQLISYTLYFTNSYWAVTVKTKCVAHGWSVGVSWIVYIIQLLILTIITIRLTRHLKTDKQKLREIERKLDRAYGE